VEVVRAKRHEATGLGARPAYPVGLGTKGFLEK
jgi:hypothetical protein